MLLVSGATRTVARYAGHRNLGRLMRPGNGNLPDGLPWAADNGAFAGFDAAAFLGMLARLAGAPGCLWVACPDVVADANATRALFEEWEPLIHELGFPVALVAQDGLTIETTPWDRCDAVFIGGSTEWKLGQVAESIARETKRRGLRLHMGRVNKARRMRVAHAWGCDTFDGTQFSRWPDEWIPWALTKLAELEHQELLPWA